MATKSDFHEIDTGVAEVLHEPDGSMVLLVNGVPSSHIVPGDPERLDFEYMRWIADFLNDQQLVDVPRWPKPRLTHLGGAACTLPRYFASKWKGSRNTVVEIDMSLAELARELFDIPRSPTVKIRVGDAREVTDSFKPSTRDIIIRDVFSSAITPRNLTTVEFFAQARNALSPEGMYVANCGSHADLKEAKEELAGMLEVWPHVSVIADPPMLKGRRYGNIVLIGANTPLEASPSLNRELLKGAVPAQFKHEKWARSLATSPRYDAPTEI